MKLIPSHPLGDQLRFWSRTFVLVGIGSTSTDRFPTLKYESPTHIQGLPTLFHMGCHITSSAMARTWLHRNASLQTQLSALAKLSDLTHSYGQNITVLSRQPTDSKVFALAKVFALLLPQPWPDHDYYVKNTYRRLPSALADNKRYHSLARKGPSPSVTTERYPTYSSSPHEELRRIASSALARRSTNQTVSKFMVVLGSIPISLCSFSYFHLLFFNSFKQSIQRFILVISVTLL